MQAIKLLPLYQYILLKQYCESPCVACFYSDFVIW